MKQTLGRLWQVPEARLPIILVGLMGLLFLFWLFGSHQPGDPRLAAIAVASPSATPSETVVKGTLRGMSGRWQPGQPAQVRLLIPALGYQAEVTVQPEDESFAIPLRLGSAPPELDFQVEAIQGQRRWILARDQVLVQGRAETPVDLLIVPQELPPPPDRRSHLADQPAPPPPVRSDFFARRDRMVEQTKTRLGDKVRR